MKAFYINEHGKLVPYNNSEIIIGDVFRFLYYALPSGGILIMAFMDFPAGKYHTEIHKKVSGVIISEDQKPVGAGLLSISPKGVRFEDWESMTMEIKTPKEYRHEIIDFFLR
ncbi:MAG: hypothetical protein UR60_C0022G0002 [Candidatus Moranbacteria bacterium GW2011_GWF2_34_56]|nr:MAG: hypothetical protein UR51_C0018G0003 [Candidatus Moranbacteria bacterium GW2011_GWF1_34_10]KKP64372.1 MAG: hypothetical protein UR60_C0022G0002 [Candidatus Moranbacteria bacterium GW2011_GWF2_34_56]HBI17513.1 hypothetical protein [Candidatus Moranbacteria bacterium]